MIKEAILSDCPLLAKMAINIWHSQTSAELEETFKDTIGKPNAVCFIIYAGTSPAGFAQCSLRHDYVEGTNSSPVGYLEGIFVEKDHRGKGFAKKLLRTCEAWARNMGCKEFASDCELDNTQSLKFHIATGFEEANRIICFKKDL